MPKTCFEKAVEFLSRRAHFHREIERKLLGRGYEEEEVAASLARLAELGYLNEEEAARAFVQQRLRRGPEGRRRLEAELHKRGAEEAAAAAALDELMPEDDAEGARKAARSWARRGKRDRQALARHLERKGFSRRAIFSALGELGGPDDDTVG